MRATMELTLDGLVRALRARAHRLADEVETHLPDAPGETTTEIRRLRDGERRTAHVSGD